jgi:hypothetical protein
MLGFLGIGAQKAATTWLFELLARHPQVRFPAGKEVHFWDQKRERGIEWWLGLFSDPTPGVLQGEITPAYALLERDDIAEIRERVPEVKLFYSIRNPMERAWSAALMALQRAELEQGEASDQWFIDHFRSRGSLARGDYEGCLRRWSSVFPREQLLVLLYDEIVRQPRSVLVGLAGHLGIDAGFFGRLPESELRRPAFPGPDVPIRRSLLPALRELYEGRIDAVAKLLGRDLGAWRSPRG